MTSLTFTDLNAYLGYENRPLLQCLAQISLYIFIAKKLPQM